MASTESSPSLEIILREPEGFSIWEGPPFTNNGQPITKLEKTQCSSVKSSEDGSILIITKSDSTISIYDSKTLQEFKSFEIPNLLASSVSPCGTYLQTFQKALNPQVKNVTLWNIRTGVAAYQLFQKNMTKTTWPIIRFSSDESVVCRMATNEVQFLDPTDFSKGFIHRIRVPGIAAMELSKSPGSYVAAFIPESKGMPASLQIIPCAKESQGQTIARKSFFRCSSVQMSWNNNSTGLLFIVQSDVDKTNQSYYGESKLHYLTIDGSSEGLVPLRKEGPVHDFQWSSSGKEFAVVYGFMPAMATIFDKKCKPILELGTGPYNTLRWNPKGKYLCLAGFGNLPGDMVFWDTIEKKKIGVAKAEWSVTTEWSPNGQYFLAATTAPRLQVDNGIKIFNHDGSLYFKKMFNKLYQAEWKSDLPEKFGDVPELVKSVETLKIGETKVQGGGSKSVQTTLKTAKPVNNIPAKPAAYRPPHAKAAANVQEELLGGGSSGGMSKNALKNKKKRENAKEKKAAESS